MTNGPDVVGEEKRMLVREPLTPASLRGLFNDLKDKQGGRVICMQPDLPANRGALENTQLNRRSC